jgi:2-dehydropantoate 2-reductase
VEHPGQIGFTSSDIVLLAMKTQDTLAALVTLAAIVPPSTPIVCLQNAVENERLAARRFANVHAVSVFCPAGFLEAGTVQAFSSPVTGILDIGRFPSGSDDVTRAVAAAFTASTFSSNPRDDIMRSKYRKLLTNLGNAAEAACGPAARGGQLVRRAMKEGEAALTVANIEFASLEEDTARRGDLLRVGSIGSRPRPGGSSWQSLARGTGNIEADYLNGEIVLLGRLHGVPTPVNALLQTTANRMAREGSAPGSLREESLLAEL